MGYDQCGAPQPSLAAPYRSQSVHVLAAAKKRQVDGKDIPSSTGQTRRQVRQGGRPRVLLRVEKSHASVEGILESQSRSRQAMLRG